jgi:hypothetical protein
MRSPGATPIWDAYISIRLVAGPFQADVPGRAFSRWIAFDAMAAGASTLHSSATAVAVKSALTRKQLY